jgi:hypothetical protein
MPEEVKQRLQKIARKKFPNDPERQDKYIYGTLRKFGWKPSGEKAQSKKAKE